MIAILASLLLAAPASPAPPAGPPPDLPASAYRERRERVMRELDGCVAVLTARGETSGVTEDYRQDGDFLWLTGVNEGEAWVLLAPRAKYDRSVLFLRPRDPERERWTGPRDPLSPALLERFGVDKVLRGRPDRTAVASAMGTDCVAVIAPVGDVKDDRPDVVLSRQVAEALGLRLVYKRDLLARLRAAH